MTGATYGQLRLRTGARSSTDSCYKKSLDGGSHSQVRRRGQRHMSTVLHYLGNRATNAGNLLILDSSMGQTPDVDRHPTAASTQYIQILVE
jgi:hypothetical protein